MADQQTSTSVTSTMEDYLEAILHMSAQSGSARSRDIAAALGVHRSTVTAALRALAEKGLVNYAPYRAVTLTPGGRSIAERIGRTHEQLETFLRDVLRIAPQAARDNACRMEHVVDRGVLDRLVGLGRYLRSRPPRSRAALERAITFAGEEAPTP